MRIAFDADNVLVPFDFYFVKFMRTKGHSISFEQMTSHNYASVFGITREETERLVTEFHDLLIDKLPLYSTVRPILMKLKEEHDLIIVTSRMPELEQMTQDYFTRMTPGIFSKIRHSANTFVGNGGSTKAEICQEENVDLMIDDVPAYLEGCSCDTLLFGDYPWNQDYKGSRVKTFSQIPEYVVNLEKSILEVRG